ncbi:MAG: cyclic pyranopterin monophosphate synthase MoaC [Candidatus Sumerlaeota bacterium]|nr:cyclic pyranopterin monophosphate synthase MoaC [Candidatus Sumerlaeota bacterium]
MALSHADDEGRARMVDVGGKIPQRRTARAEGRIALAPETIALIRANQIQKGDVLTVARIAGIQAAKRTAELIPLCHPLPLDKIDVSLILNEDCVVARSEVGCVGKTGVEMEALTGVSVALLAVYDMCKSVDSRMRIGGIHLVEKVKRDVEPD